MVSGNTSIRLSQVPLTAYAVVTNLDTFCIIINPRHTDGCLLRIVDPADVLAIVNVGIGEGGVATLVDVSGEAGDLNQYKFTILWN